MLDNERIVSRIFERKESRKSARIEWYEWLAEMWVSEWLVKLRRLRACNGKVVSTMRQVRWLTRLCDSIDGELAAVLDGDDGENGNSGTEWFKQSARRKLRAKVTPDLDDLLRRVQETIMHVRAWLRRCVE